MPATVLASYALLWSLADALWLEIIFGGLTIYEAGTLAALYLHRRKKRLHLGATASPAKLLDAAETSEQLLQRLPSAARLGREPTLRKRSKVD